MIASIVLAAMSAESGQASAGLEARLDAAVMAQKEARQRLSKGLEGRETQEVQQPAYDRYQAETRELKHVK